MAWMRGKSDDSVIVTAHHDHLGSPSSNRTHTHTRFFFLALRACLTLRTGIGPADERNDTIYNGAMDNAAGVLSPSISVLCAHVYALACGFARSCSYISLREQMLKTVPVRYRAHDGARLRLPPSTPFASPALRYLSLCHG
jgi:hypothetical protein